MIRTIIILLLIGHSLTEAATFIEWRFPELIGVEVQPFWFYHYPYGKGIDLMWFIKFTADNVLWILYCVGFCLATFRHSERLFIVGVQWLLYHLFDAVMFHWNFRQSWWLHWVVLIIVIGNIIVVAWPRQKLRAA